MTLATREDLLICVACGTQFDVPAAQPLKACRICDDPRQYVPPTGQAWTSLSDLRSSDKNYHNVISQDPHDPHMYTITTEPKVGIGQRAFFLQTPSGNVLWDLIAYLDEETVEFIQRKGGLKAIVISHPHYYTTHLDWARTFGCPVYVAREDEEWLCQKDEVGVRKFIEGQREVIVDGIEAIKVGGHFPGSLVLLWEKKLFIADTIVTTPSGLYHIDRPEGTNSFVFMWSIPNMIPLPPAELFKMWQALRPLEFESTHGAFAGLDIRDQNVKARVLESMRIQARNEGWDDVEILKESV